MNPDHPGAGGAGHELGDQPAGGGEVTSRASPIPKAAPCSRIYVLNQFDASLPLHLDVREVLRRQLGDRLLPFVIRRSPAVSEALAEGMTVVDYAPEAPVAEDYMNIAGWLRDAVSRRRRRASATPDGVNDDQVPTMERV